MLEAATVVAVVLLVIVAAFQIGLAAGAPWGRAAWGGRHGRILTYRLRIASGIAGLLVYPIIIVWIASVGGLIGGSTKPGGRIAMWVFAALFFVGALANAASRSSIERLWAPVSLTIAICCAIVAFTL